MIELVASVALSDWLSSVFVGAGVLVGLCLVWRIFQLGRGFLPRHSTADVHAFSSWPEVSASVVTFALVVTPLLGIVRVRQLHAERYYHALMRDLPTESELLLRFGSYALPLLGLWGVTVAARSAARMTWCELPLRIRAAAAAAIGAVATFWVDALAQTRRALIAFAGNFTALEPDGRPWVTQLEATRPAVTDAMTLLGWAVVAMGATLAAVNWWLDARRNASVQGTEPAPGLEPARARRLRLTLLFKVFACGAVASACLGVTTLAGPLAAEASQPLPVTGHHLGVCPACIWKFAQNRGNGPDEFPDGISLVLRDARVELYGSKLEHHQVADELRNRRELWELLNPGVSRKAEDLFVLLDASPWEPVHNVMRALSAVRKGRFVEVRLVLTDRVKLESPTLGKLVGDRPSTVRVRLANTHAECAGLHYVPKQRVEESVVYSVLLAQLLDVRMRGSVPCVFVGEGGPAPLIRAEHVQIDDVTFDVVTVDESQSVIEMFLRDSKGRRLGSLGALRQELESQGLELVMGMNAGMYTPSRAPVGLFVEQGRELAPLDTNDGEGNFYLKPNGVFAVELGGSAFIVDSKHYRAREDTVFATQSGPLLLDRGEPHPSIRPNSPYRQIRNAVGDCGNDVVFVISQDRVNFEELLQVFVELGCTSALYLDGSVSRMYAPMLGRHDVDGDFGPIVGVVRVR